MKKPQRFCIFCNGPHLSKEHLWADWMKGFLPQFDATAHSIGYHKNSPNFLGPSNVRGKLHRPVTPKSMRLRIVCENCNSGWMSRLQKATKPILMPFLKGVWKQLHVVDQRTLSAWAVMFSMVIEFTDEKSVSTPQEQRKFLMTNNYPSKHWYVWIGHFEQPDSFFRRWSFVEEESPVSADGSYDYKFGFTVFGAGHAIFQTIGFKDFYPTSKTLSALDAHARLLKLQRIWPTRSLFRRALPSPIKVGDVVPYIEGAARLFAN